MSTQSDTPPAVEAFVSRLEELAAPGAEDRASLARLKRAAGHTLPECGSLMPLFYRLLPHSVQRQEQEEAYFLVATLFPFATRRWTGNMGRSLRLLKSQPDVNEAGIDRRMAVLLDAARGELPFRLRQMTRLLTQHDLPVDWRQLLQDLQAWEHPSRRVQKWWARNYFGWSPDEAAYLADTTTAPESGNE